MRKLLLLWTAGLAAALAWAALSSSRPAALGASSGAARGARPVLPAPAADPADEAAGFNTFHLLSAEELAPPLPGVKARPAAPRPPLAGR